MFGLGGKERMGAPPQGRLPLRPDQLQAVTAAPKFIFACDCTDCQQLTSSAFSMGMAVEESAFDLEGTPSCLGQNRG